MSTTLLPVDDAEAVAERLMADVATMSETLAVHIGMELGLFAVLADGPRTPGELAARAGIDPRYAREWLEQLAVAGLLRCPEPGNDADERRFELPPALAEVLLDGRSDAYLGPLLGMAGGMAAVVRDVVDAFRTGGGVPYHAYGAELRHGLADMNGAVYEGELAGWIEHHVTDVHERLRTADTPRILDLGCGTGTSTLILARAYPRATVRGVDLDAASVDEARDAAARAGLAHRVTFEHGDAAGLGDDGGYDLVTILEALHDMGDPVGALTRVHDLLAPEGAAFVMDERAADEFRPDGDVLERFLYAASVLHCLPATMAEDPVVANGTVLRASTVDDWARAAGFDGATVLDIDNPFWRMYRM